MKPIRRFKITHPRLVYGLLMILAGVVLLDLALWKVDPIGLVTYHHDYNDLMLLSIPAPDGYRLTPGYHRLHTYSVTIGLDGLRVVPVTHYDQSCKIAFIGDSITFGMGSSVSFVDILAPDLPATVINAGLPTYSAANVSRLMKAIPADGYIWMVISNDDDPAYQWIRGSNVLPMATELYRRWWFDAPITRYPERFIENAAPDLTRDDVLAFAFEGQMLTGEAVNLGAVSIPWYTNHVSRVDTHPNTAGAYEIAAAMHDSVMEFVSRICGGIG